MRFIERILLVPDHKEPPVMLAYVAAQLENYEVKIGTWDTEWDADMVVLQCNDIRDREYIIFNSKLVKDHDTDTHVAVCGDAVGEHYEEMGDDIDWYLSGEADHTLESLCNIQNIDIRPLPDGYPEEIPVFTLDILPTPDWDSWEGLEKHLAKKPASLPVVISRGDRVRSVENISEEVAEVMAKYNLSGVNRIAK